MILCVRKVLKYFVYFPYEKCFVSDVNPDDVQCDCDEMYPPIGHTVKMKDTAHNMANQVGKFLGMNSYDLFTVSF